MGILSSLFGRRNGRNSRAARRKPAAPRKGRFFNPTHRLGFEPLEERRLLSIPTAPSNLSLDGYSYPTYSQVDLDWTDNSNNETGFKVLRSDDYGCGWSVIATLGANITHYEDATAIEGYYNCYRVVAYNGDGDSSPASNSEWIPPAPPTNLVATADSGTQVTLTWDNNSSWQDYIRIGISTDGGQNYSFPEDPLYGGDSFVFSASTSYYGDLTPGTLYYFQVFAVGIDGNSPSNVAYVTTPNGEPAAPSNLAAGAYSSGQIDLAWTDNSTDESGFKIERSADGVSGWSLVATAAANATFYSNNNDLDEGTTYSYRVRATNGCGDSNNSNAASAATLPAAPSDLSATAFSDTRIDLAWTDNSSHESGFIIEESYDGVAGWTTVGTVAANVTVYNCTGLHEGVPYYYRVRATNGSDESANSNTASAQTFLATPTNLTVVSISATGAHLTWDDNSDFETGYNIYLIVEGVPELIGSIEPHWQQQGNDYYWVDDDAGNSSYLFQQLEQYTFQVRAYGSVNSDYSDPATETAGDWPDAPTDFTADPLSGTDIRLTWTDNSDNELGFRIERSLNYWLEDDRCVADLDPGETSFTDTMPDLRIEGNGPVSYRIWAYNNDGYSLYDEIEETATLPWPAAPTYLTAAADGDSQITLHWTDRSNLESGYLIERMTNTTAWAALATVDPGQGTGPMSYVDDDLIEGMNECSIYYYRIRATGEPYDSNYSDMAFATTLPPAPENLQASFTDGGQVAFTWDDVSTTNEGYAIDQWNGADWDEVLTAAADAEYAALAGLFAPSTEFQFRVRAYKHDFNVGRLYSLASADAETTAAWPDAPTDLVAEAVSESQIDLSWLDNADDETDYEIWQSLDGLTNWTLIDLADANNTSQHIFDLSGGEGTTYYYRVRAVNAQGDSAFTEVAFAETLPATPTGLTASIDDGATANLAWTDNSTMETAYVVEQWDAAEEEWDQVQWTGDHAGTGAMSLAVLGTFEPTVQYTFRVRAYAEGDKYAVYSAASNSASDAADAWPLAPTELTAAAVSNTQINLAWTDNADNETGYLLERSADGGATWPYSITLDDDAESYNNTGLVEGRLYVYRIRAVNLAGDSAYAYAYAATPPDAPANPTATVLSGTSVYLDWDAAPYATGYTISMYEEGAADWDVVDSVPSTQTDYTVTGLSPGGVSYAFRVAPTNSTAAMAVAYMSVVATQNQAPDVTGITPGAATVTTTSTTLAAAAADDGGENKLTYSWSILSAPSSGGGYFTLNDTNTAKNTTVVFYAAGDYTIQVTVTDAAGVSSTESISVTVA